jgi:mono/diheme cytochrome c family protein
MAKQRFPLALTTAVLSIVGMLALTTMGCGLRPHDPADDERPNPQTARDADARRGAAVAERWCIACHVVAPGVTVKPEQASAPSFVSIALDQSKDSKYLARFLDGVHPPMPTYRLFPEEKRDLLEYLVGLGASR